MAITVNGDSHPWREGLTVDQLMEEKSYTFPLKIVVINGERVPKSEWGKHVVRDGDDVHVIHMMSGG